MKKPTIKKKPGSSPSDVAYDAATFLRCDGRARRAARGVAERHLHEAESETSRRRLRRQSVRSVLFFCFVLPSAAFGQTPPAPPPQCFFTRSKREKTPRSASGRRRRRPERVLKKKKTLKGVNSFFIFLPPRHSLLRRPGYHRAEDRAGTGTARCRFVNGERHVTFRLSTGRGPETRDLGAAMCVRGVDVH